MKLMPKLLGFTLLIFLHFNLIGHAQKVATLEGIKEQINATGQAVREAFKNQDIEAVKSYHHPDVIKALGYNNLKRGRQAVLEGLKETMSQFDLEFIGEREEELFIYEGNMVIKQMRFGLKLLPKNGDAPFIYRGRTVVILQRYESSPTGWATIYEMIQPYEEQ